MADEGGIRLAAELDRSLEAKACNRFKTCHFNRSELFFLGRSDEGFCDRVDGMSFKCVSDSERVIHGTGWIFDDERVNGGTLKLSCRQGAGFVKSDNRAAAECIENNASFEKIPLRAQALMALR